MKREEYDIPAMPRIGAGLGYRRQMRNAILARRGELDLLEITTDHFTGNSRQRAELEELAALIPCVPHGLRLSIGAAGPPSRATLETLRTTLEITGASYYTDHLALTAAPGIELGHLSPVWLTRKSLDSVVRNVSTVQEYTGRMLALENISYSFDIPRRELRQTEFFCELVERTGCGLLLDVTNLFINAFNERFDPLDWLDQIPLHRIVHVHLAGGTREGAKLYDTHSEAVDAGTWALFEKLAPRADLKSVIVERDANIPPIEELLADVATARRALMGAAVTIR
jgi:hypothetical protein